LRFCGWWRGGGAASLAFPLFFPPAFARRYFLPALGWWGWWAGGCLLLLRLRLRGSAVGGRARARGNAVLGTWLFYSSTAGCVVWDATVKHQIALLKAVAIENARICWCCSRWNRCLASFVYPIFCDVRDFEVEFACCLASLFIQFFLCPSLGNVYYNSFIGTAA